VATAHERNDHDAFYACGAVFALIAEKANGGDFSGFVRRLVEANRADRRLNRAEWLTELARLSGSSESGRQISAMLDQGATDPSATIAELLRDAGLAFGLDEKGVPQLS
jgi:hypothetical protein